MSSHHFVKEGQEPALLIADSVAISHVESLLEWAPLVVAIHTTVHDVILRGTKVDVVVCLSDQVDELSQTLQDQSPLEIIAAGPGHELTRALQYLEKQDQRAVNIIAAGGNAIFAQILPFASKFVVTVVDDHHKWSLVNGRFRKWMPANQTLHIIKTNDNQHISQEGLQGQDTVFSTVHAGMATLTTAGFFWVGEPL